MKVKDIFEILEFDQFHVCKWIMVSKLIISLLPQRTALMGITRKKVMCRGGVTS